MNSWDKATDNGWVSFCLNPNYLSLSVHVVLPKPIAQKYDNNGGDNHVRCWSINTNRKSAN